MHISVALLKNFQLFLNMKYFQFLKLKIMASISKFVLIDAGMFKVAG